MNVWKFYLLCGAVAFCSSCNDQEIDDVGGVDDESTSRSPRDARKNSQGVEAFRLQLRNSKESGAGVESILAELCGEASLEQLPEVWSMIEGETLPERVKFGLQAQLLRELAKKGFTTDVLNFAIENQGPGLERNRMIAAIFTGRLLPVEEALQLIDSLEYADEKRAMAAGMGGVALMPDDFEKLKPYLDSTDDTLRQGGLSSLVGSIWGGKYQEAIPAVLEILSGQDSKLRNEGLNHFVRNSPRIDPVFVYDQITSKFGDEAFRALEVELQGKLVDQMAVDAPDKSIERFVTLGEDYAPELSRVFEVWFHRDTHPAVEWFDQNQHTLNQGQHDGVVEQIVKGALKNGEVAVAEEWVDLLQNQKTADEVRSKLESFEKKPSE